jgi:secondary thiamine-phosphate synthase enzyme
MRELHIQTIRSKQLIDITETINQYLATEQIQNGMCHIFVLHTTASITTADLDPGTDLDTLDALEHIMPKLSFRHPHNPAHAPDHIWSSIIGPSLTIPIKNGELFLGMWQRVVVVELDGPRERTMVITTTT